MYQTPFEKHLDDVQQRKQEHEEEKLSAIPNRRGVPWVSDVMENMRSRGRGNAPSPILCWWEQESKKRAQGLENEIDINEMKAALKGVKNKWFSRVKAHRNIFEAYTEGKGHSWDEIKSLTDQPLPSTGLSPEIGDKS